VVNPLEHHFSFSAVPIAKTKDKLTSKQKWKPSCSTDAIKNLFESESTLKQMD
jgi:hypothetical protein